MPGAGINQWPLIMDRLAQAGYSGPFLCKIWETDTARDITYIWHDLQRRYVLYKEASREP
ncbi:hypothetical protein [Paenibacillus profundus]|nr:hypothetical protein [Paenibacillus profundus]